MTTPTNETRDTGRDQTRPESEAGTGPPQKIDLSVTKIAAGAGAAALAAAVGSKLGVAGTIVGAAVASVVSTSASTVIGHSLERGKTAARKAMPVLDPEQLETAILSRARIARTERSVRAANGAHRMPMPEMPMPESTAEQTRVDDQAVALPVQPVLQQVAPDTPRTWKDRLPGRKPLIAAAVASFVIGTGAVTALEVARKGEFPGYHSNVFDPGRGSGSTQQQPASQSPSGGGTHERATPSQKPDSSPPPSSSASASQTPSATPSTPATSDATPSSPTMPSGTPTPGATTPSTAPTTQPTGSPDPTAVPSTPGAATPSSAATGAGKVTPTGGGTG